MPDDKGGKTTALGTAKKEVITELEIVSDDVEISAEILQGVVTEAYVAPSVMEVEEVAEEMAFILVEDGSSRQRRRNQSNQKSSQPEIKLAPIKQENTYSALLTGNLDDDYATYLRLRPEYINTPTFYFDMADWFFRKNDRERALRILTSIADLDLENASLFRLLGYRFKEYGEYALQLHVCKKVIQWRPMEPQSYRDYALALADIGDHQAALDSLYGVLKRYYAQNILGRSQRIEEVIVTEIMHLITKYPNLRTDSLPKEFIQSIPVDIRVVTNWNMQSTIIDLHVVDPNGEHCYYVHPNTAIGGRLSYHTIHDYGPIQFMLKKAIPGTYKVFVNYYSDSQVKAEGPSTIMAEIYLRYADKTEQRQIVCLQLSKEKANQTSDGKLLVAEFEF